MSTSRRNFLEAVGAMAFGPFRDIRPDLILHNGAIPTMDLEQPRAQSIAIARGRFQAVGSNDEVKALRANGTKVVDLEGRTVVPGFIDAHSHPASSGRRHLREVDCDLRSIEEIQAAIRARCGKTPAGQWVLGFKYDDTKTREGRPLTRDDLDAGAPNHPVYVNHRGGHTSYVNSLAFKLAGVGEKTPDPPGGQLDRDSSTGRLLGCVRERATEAFHKVIPSGFTRDDYREGVKLISQMMTRAGVTSVHDTGGSPENLRAYQDAHEAGELGLRVYCLIRYGDLDSMIQAGARTGLGNEWVRVGAVKLVCDGSISERTAYVSQPYVGRPNDYGILVTPEEELYAQARKGHEAGWQRLLNSLIQFCRPAD